MSPISSGDARALTLALVIVIAAVVLFVIPLMRTVIEDLLAHRNGKRPT
jgi:hypothetical protein